MKKILITLLSIGIIGSLSMTFCNFDENSDSYTPDSAAVTSEESFDINEWRHKESEETEPIVTTVTETAESEATVPAAVTTVTETTAEATTVTTVTTVAETTTKATTVTTVKETTAKATTVTSATTKKATAATKASTKASTTKKTEKKVTTKAETTKAPTEVTTVQQKAPQDSEEYVWVPTNGGKKYHSRKECSNMIDPRYIPKSQAISEGFTACKRCYKQR